MFMHVHVLCVFGYSKTIGSSFWDAHCNARWNFALILMPFGFDRQNKLWQDSLDIHALDPLRASWLCYSRSPVPQQTKHTKYNCSISFLFGYYIVISYCHSSLIIVCGSLSVCLGVAGFAHKGPVWKGFCHQTLWSTTREKRLTSWKQMVCDGSSPGDLQASMFLKIGDPPQ